MNPHTHLLACNQQNGALLGVHHLAEDVVKDEKLTPAVLKEFHLVINLKQIREREKKHNLSKAGFVFFSGIRSVFGLIKDLQVCF